MKSKQKLTALLLAGCLLLAGTGCNGEASSEESESRLYPMRIDLTPKEDSSLSSDSSTSSDSSVQQESGSGGSSSTSIPQGGGGDTSSEPEAPKTVRVTFPEGYSVAQIFNRLEEKGVCSAAELFATVNTYDFSYYPLVAQIGTTGTGNRCFRLEGYLFPNTYEFYLNDKPENVIGVLLRGAQSKITTARPGYTIDETLTVASLIERETDDPAQMANVASVIYNRLESGMKLQIDATIVYVERYIKPYISGDVNRYNADYNTYKCPGLPAGPICNPGSAAINAAVNPAQTNYLYFVTGGGQTLYASTYEEHQQNCQALGVEPSESL